MESALQQGLGYALFVCLLLYVLKTTGDREIRYQTLLDKITDKLNIVKDIEEDVKEIKNLINDDKRKGIEEIKDLMINDRRK